MRRVIFPAVDPAISRQLSLNQSQRHGNGSPADANGGRMSEVEARIWARPLIDQYGDDAEELAEIGVVEMLALKKGTHLVAWSMIYAAIREIRARAPRLARK